MFDTKLRVFHEYKYHPQIVLKEDIGKSTKLLENVYSRKVDKYMTSQSFPQIFGQFSKERKIFENFKTVCTKLFIDICSEIC